MHDLMVHAGKPSFAGMKNYVFSRSKAGKGEGGVQFVSSELRSFVEKLRGQAGKTIWLAGGGN
jgi:dihydrofolate reductase